MIERTKVSGSVPVAYQRHHFLPAVEYNRGEQHHHAAAARHAVRAGGLRRRFAARVSQPANHPVPQQTTRVRGWMGGWADGWMDRKKAVNEAPLPRTARRKYCVTICAT